MNAVLTGWLNALRIARREAWRSKGRAALVATMIGLPVAALAFAAVTYDSFRLTPAERFERDGGRADAIVQWAYVDRIDQEPTSLNYVPHGSSLGKHTQTEEAMRALLPAGSRLTSDVLLIARVHTPAGIDRFRGRAIDLTDPLAIDIATIRGGRAATGPGEVAISQEAAAVAGTRLGGTLRLTDGSMHTVVGIMEFSSDLGAVVVFAPGHLPRGASIEEHQGSRRWLVDTPTPMTWERVTRLNANGVVALSREVIRNPPTEYAYPERQINPPSFPILVAGAAGLEIVLLAGPAFAIGARRRQRDLALLAANGAGPGQLRRVVLADGVVLGLLGAACGLVVGVLTAAAARGLLEQHVMHARAGGLRVFPLALAAIVALAVGTAVVAAAVPAFLAARQDVVAGLAGRRGVTRSRRRWVAVGLAMIAAGLVVTAYGALRVDQEALLAGLILGEIGLALCTPALLGLIARAGSVLPLTVRIAVRDAARNRTAAAPAVAAVMAAVAGSVMLGTYHASSDAHQVDGYMAILPHGHAAVTLSGSNAATADAPRNDMPVDAVAAAMRASLPVRDVAPLREYVCPPGARTCRLSVAFPPDHPCAHPTRRGASCDSWPSSYGLATTHPIVDADHVGTVTGATGPDLVRARETIRAGGVVVYDHRYVRDGTVTLALSTTDGRQEPALTETRVTVPGYALSTPIAPGNAALSVGAAERLQLGTRLGGVIAATQRMPTEAEENRLAAAVAEIGDWYGTTVERGPEVEPDPTALLMALAAGIITLGAAGTATSLGAVDSRGDVATLGAVGASPAVRQRLSLSQSGVVAGLGSLLGCAVGLAMATLIIVLATHSTVYGGLPPKVVLPWPTLGLALVVVPAIAMLSAALLTRSRLPVERRL